MRRVISMPVAIIAALVLLAGFDSNARPDEQAQLLKALSGWSSCCAYAIVRPFIASLTSCPV